MGEGANSTTPATPMTIPTAPRFPETNVGNGSVNLSWTAPSFDGGSALIKYNIYRNDTMGIYANISAGQLWFNDTGVSNGVSYTYKVSAVNIMGESPLSEEVNATPATVPSPPKWIVIAFYPDLYDPEYVIVWEPTSDGGSPISNYTLYWTNSSSGQTITYDLGNQTIYSDTNISNGFTYLYEVTARNAVGEGQPSTELNITPMAPLTAPKNLQTHPGDSYINLTWESPASSGSFPITNYMIYKRDEHNLDFFFIEIGNVTYFNDTGTTNGITYYYNVSAVNLDGQGPRSKDVSGVYAVVPNSPVDPNAISGDSFVYLTWGIPNDGGADITNYRIYRGTEPGTVTFFIEIGDVTFFNDSSVSNSITYYYTISAVNAIGEGPLSEEVNATPSGVPSAPLEFSATPGNSYVLLNWNEPASTGGFPVINYTIYRSDASGSEIFIIEVGNITQFNDTNVINGNTYYYTVRAINIIGEGAQSYEKSALPKGPPTAPYNLQAHTGDSYVNITWSPPTSNGGAAITNYSIYRGLSSGGETFLITIGNILYYNDTNAKNGVTYYYWVSALNSLGEGELSNETSGTPLAVLTVPSAPHILQINAGDSYLNFTWSAPAIDGGSPIIAYRIYRGTSSGGESFLIEIGNVSYYNDTEVSNGVTYYYKISAISNEVSATPLTPFVPPKQDSEKEEDSLWLWIVLAIIVVVFLIVFFLSYSKRRKEESLHTPDESEKEHSPPPEKVEEDRPLPEDEKKLTDEEGVPADEKDLPSPPDEIEDDLPPPPDELEEELPPPPEDFEE
jgi:titin